MHWCRHDPCLLPLHMPWSAGRCKLLRTRTSACACAHVSSSVSHLARQRALEDYEVHTGSRSGCQDVCMHAFDDMVVKRRLHARRAGLCVAMWVRPAQAGPGPGLGLWLLYVHASWGHLWVCISSGALVSCSTEPSAPTRRYTPIRTSIDRTQCPTSNPQRSLSKLTLRRCMLPTVVVHQYLRSEIITG